MNVDDSPQGFYDALTALMAVLNREMERRLALICFGFDKIVSLIIVEYLDCLCMSAESGNVERCNIMSRFVGSYFDIAG